MKKKLIYIFLTIAFTFFASKGYSEEALNIANCNSNEKECTETPPTSPCEQECKQTPPPTCEKECVKSCPTPCVQECINPCPPPCTLCCICTPKPSCEPPCECAYNAPFRVGTCWDFFASTSFLFWEAMEGGLDLGDNTSTNPNNVGTNFNLISVQRIEMNYEFNPGFRVGLGSNFDWDQWEVYAEYTWFHHTTNTSNSGDFVTDRLTWTPPYLNGESIENRIGTSMSASWRVDLDIVDLELSRSFYVGRLLTFRPFFGGRGAWISQGYNLTLSGALDSPITTDCKSANWGVGIRAGLDTRWSFCYGFYLFGDVASSLLYTQFDEIKIHFTDRINEITLKKKRKSVEPEFDIAFGFGWGDYIDCKNRWYLNLSAGYEFTYFFEQNGFRDFFFSNSENPNLSFQGLTLKARVDF